MARMRPCCMHTCLCFSPRYAQRRSTLYACMQLASGLLLPAHFPAILPVCVVLQMLRLTPAACMYFMHHWQGACCARCQVAYSGAYSPPFVHFPDLPQAPVGSPPASAHPKGSTSTLDSALSYSDSTTSATASSSLSRYLSYLLSA